MEPKHKSLSDLERIGAYTYSKWISAKSGRLLVIVNRGWNLPPNGKIPKHWIPNENYKEAGLFLTILDVEAEKVTDVMGDDFIRWFNDQRIMRKF